MMGSVGRLPGRSIFINSCMTSVTSVCDKLTKILLETLWDEAKDFCVYKFMSLFVNIKKVGYEITYTTQEQQTVYYDTFLS